MPRDSNGNYTLPAGNPVVTGEVISTGWANPTMSDLGAEITNSLDRQGRGGMLAPFKFVDGTNSQPGITWTAEPTTGFYRAGAADQRATVAGVARMRWTGTGVDVYDTVAGTWVALSNASGTNFAILNASNVFTQPQRVQFAQGEWAIYKDATPTKAARFALNNTVADGIDLSLYDGANWKPKFLATGVESNYANNTHVFADTANAVQLARFTSGANSFGPVAYVPATPTVKSLGMVSNGTDTAVVGCYANDGTYNPRAELFAGGTVCGINWSFSGGVNAFQFRRTGTEIFSYNEGGVQLRSGLSFQFWNAANNDVSSVAQNGAILDFNTGTANTFRFLTGTSSLAVNNSGISVENGKSLTMFNSAHTYNASLVCINTIAYFAGNVTGWEWQLAGNIVCGVTAGAFNFYNATSGRFVGPGFNGLTSMYEGGGSDGFRINQESGQPIRFLIGGSEMFNVNSGGITMASTKGLYFAQAALSNGTTGGLQGLIARDTEGWKGPVLYHNDQVWQSGTVFLKENQDPAVSGFTPGTLWFVYE